MRTRVILPAALATALGTLPLAACGADDEPDGAAADTADAAVCEEYASLTEAAGEMFANFESMSAEQLRSAVHGLIEDADRLSESALEFAELRDGLNEADRRLAERGYDVDQPRAQDAFDNVQFDKGGEGVERWAAEACGDTGDAGDEDSDQG